MAEYAQVLRMLGNGRLEATCIDGIKRLCHIRGKMRKKVWVNTVCHLSLCSAMDSLGGYVPGSYERFSNERYSAAG